MSLNSVPPVAAVILAGGQARRMGGEKAFAQFAGKPLIAHTIARLAPQAERLAINANGDPSRFAALTLPVIADTIADFPGPLAGILAAMEWCAATAPALDWVLTAPVDCPFLPDDLTARLFRAATPSTEIVVARSDGRLHPVIALWRVALREELSTHLAAGGTRKVETWMAGYRCRRQEWPAAPFDPFFNINTPDDLKTAEARLAGN